MNNIVVGGGITGIFSAYLLKSLYPEKNVVIIENDSELGGLLKSKCYKEYGKFDFGVHTFYETGIQFIDDFFIENQPDSGWNFLNGYERDKGACILDGKINFNSPYIDLRNLPLDRLSRYRSEIIHNLKFKNNKKSYKKNATEYLKKIFGKSLTRDYFKNLISARQHSNADEIHKTSVMIQKLDRVVLFDLDELLGQNIPEKLKNISAFPDQLNYPKKFLTDKRVFYPNKIGIDNAIRALIEHIVKIGVKIFTNSKIKKIEFNKNRIENICLQRNYDEYNKIKTDNIIWTVPPFSLYKLLFPKIEFPIFDPPKKTIIINILTSEAPNSQGVYWMLSHGHEFIHRISFPNNYSNETEQSSFKICVECILEKDASILRIKEKVINFLVRNELISSRSSIIFSDLVVAPGGFPNLSLKNVNGLEKIRDEVNDIGINNFFNVGILSQDDMFFQFDLIKNCYEKLRHI